MKTSSLSLLALAGLASMIPSLRAADSDPLERMTPVPADQPIPLEDFFRPPLFTSPQINEAGTRFAALVTDSRKDKESLLVVNLENNKPTEMNAPGDKEIFQFGWLDNRNVLCRLNEEKHYAVGMLVIPVDDAGNSYFIEQYNALRVLGVPKKAPMKPVIWLQQNAWDDGRDYGVLKLDASQPLKAMDGVGYLDSKKYPYGTQASVVRSYPTPPEGTPVYYQCDRNGELAFGYTAIAGKDTLWVFKDGKTWVKSPIDLDDYDILAAGDAPDEVIALAPSEDHKPRMVLRMDAETGKPVGNPLYQDLRYSPSTAWFYRDPGTNRIVGMKFFRQTLQTAWFSEDYEALQKRIAMSLPLKNVEVDILGSDEASTRFVVSAGSDVMPQAYYQVDLAKGRIGLIKSTRPWIDPARMCPMQVHTYRTRDGHKVEFYLTLPAGASRQHPVPMVVYPHGGPWVRDVWGWDPVVQFLASRGYAVFQPNYRGSSGYDAEFSHQDEWDFARMNDDVADGVRLLLRTGVIDKNRVAIMGASFGGYLALAGVESNPDLYRCAVTIAGVFDYAKVMADAKRLDDTRVRFDYFLRHLGDPEKNEALFNEISPLRHVDRVKVPVFVVHGKLDDVADSSQSKKLVSELEKYHVPYEAHFLSGEGHGIFYLKHRIEVFGDIEKFLATNLAPRKS